MYGSGSFACANKSMYTDSNMQHCLAHLSVSPLLALASHGKYINPQITSEFITG